MAAGRILTGLSGKVIFRSEIRLALIMALLAVVTGCAGTATGARSSAMNGAADVEVTDYSLSRADALVVIRYPAIIHADAQEPYFHAFSINAIGGEVPPANRTKKVTTRIAQSVIAKSNYYVMSLYREFGRNCRESTPTIQCWPTCRKFVRRPGTSSATCSSARAAQPDSLTAWETGDASIWSRAMISIS